MSLFSSSQSFVQRIFPPLIGSLTSASVEEICQKNNVSFTELLQPFCNVYVDHQLKDPSGNDLYIKHLKVGVQDVKGQPPLPAVARRLLNEAVAGAWCDVTTEVITKDTLPGLHIDIPVDCPWFDAWREMFLNVQYPSDHEFMRNLLGCILVTSTQDPPETMQVLLEALKQMQLPDSDPKRLPKWFCPAIFKFYVVVHDARSGDKTKAFAFFESIKTAYGADYCFFLEINSRQNGENEVIDHWTELKPKMTLESEVPVLSTECVPVSANLVHPLSPNLENHYNVRNANEEKKEHRGVESAKIQCGTCLSSRDVDSLRELMCNVVRNALLPHVEKQIFILNDLVANKKGMSRSLLSATKRLFGSPRPGGPAGPASAPIFSSDASELQLRRLGDLYFIFSSYSNAFQAYYAAKRELSTEQAWLHYAGALEMTALSAFMLPEPSKKAVEYMEEAITIYLNSLNIEQFATRATLLGVTCLKEREMFAEAAKQLIRMTSEGSDLRSALLLEQAAYCVLRNSKFRKYAFNMVLAGHRFSKAGQRRHALRCVRQALQVYGGRGWCLAEDHIHSTIGRLSGQLQDGPGCGRQLLGEGLRSLSLLLNSRSRQGAAQQAAYLLEYLNMQQTWEPDEDEPKLTSLPLPVIEDNSASVRVVAAMHNGGWVNAFHSDLPGEALRWARMEEWGLTETMGVPMVFRPSLPVQSKATLNTHGPVVALNERLEVYFGLHNPLQISLPVTRLRLLWTWTGVDGAVVHGGDEPPGNETVAITDELPSLLLPPQATHYVTLGVVPRYSGTLHITGIACSLTTAVTSVDQVPPVVRGRQDLIVRGPKLRPPKDRPTIDCYADDKRLHANVVSTAPLVTISGVPPNLDMVCGQLQQVQLDLRNHGNMAVTSLHVVTDAADLLILPEELSDKVKTTVDEDTSTHLQVVTIESGCLQPEEKLPLRLWVRAPDVRGTKRIHLLFLYAGASEGIRHRVARLTIKLTVADGVQMSAVATRSPQGGELSNICISASNQHLASASLRCLALASHQWKLQGPPLCPKDDVIGPSLSLHLVSKAYGSDEADKSCAVTSLSLSEASVSLQSAVSRLLLSRIQSNIMVLGLIWESSLEENSIEGLSIVDIAAMGASASNISPVTIDLAVPHTVRIFGPDRHLSVPATSGASLTSVSLSLSHPDLVSHCFTQNRMCLVNVTLTITNSSPDQLIVELNTSRTPNLSHFPPRSHVYMTHASSAFTWVGRARTTLMASNRSCTSIVLRAAVTQPGTYDLAIRINAAVRGAQGLTSLPPPPESPLVVTDVS